MAETKKRRIGVFGGTFDPIHFGHLIIAENAREEARLDEVLFIPAARPPHKMSEAIAPFKHRCEMIRLAVAGVPVFRVSEIEKDRPGPSYTADTLACLQADFPDAELALILGSDCLPDFPHWYEPARIIERAELVIANRGSLPTWTSEKLADVLRLPKHIAIRQTVLRIPEIGISGTDIRARVASGRTIRFLTPRAVECYIETHRLYRRSAS